MVSCGKLTSPAALRQPLERLYRDFDYKARLGRDAIQYPLRYADAADREIVALLTACLAYGRVDLFGRALERALSAMGPSPAAFVREFDAARDAAVFAGFIYRFNRPRDLVAFCVAARDVVPRAPPRREQGRGRGPHAPAPAELEDGGRDRRAPGAAGPRRSGEVRLRAVSHAHGRRLPRPPRPGGVPAVRTARGLPSLEAGSGPPEASMTEVTGILLGALLVVLAVVAWTLFAARRELAQMRSQPPVPDPSVALLRQEIESVRHAGPQ